jgi:hypothetical protein
MQLNDEADDENRQRLLPFVTRLACADTREVERDREAYIKAGIKDGLTFARGLEILESALRIGRQADELTGDDVRNRMEAVQRSARSPTSIPDTPVFAKLKSWLALA